MEKGVEWEEIGLIIAYAEATVEDVGLGVEVCLMVGCAMHVYVCVCVCVCQCFFTGPWYLHILHLHYL